MLGILIFSFLLEEFEAFADIFFIERILVCFYWDISFTASVVNGISRLLENFPHLLVIFLLASSLVDR